MVAMVKRTTGATKCSFAGFCDGDLAPSRKIVWQRFRMVIATRERIRDEM